MPGRQIERVRHRRDEMRGRAGPEIPTEAGRHILDEQGQVRAFRSGGRDRHPDRVAVAVAAAVGGLDRDRVGGAGRVPVSDPL